MTTDVRIKPKDLRPSEKLLVMHWPFVSLVVLIGFIGYLILFSAGGGSHEPWAWRHALRLCIGGCVMVAVAFTDIRFWFRWAYPIYAAGFALVLAVEVAGSLSNGAQRWIDLGVIQLQPSELMKMGLVLCLARYLHGAYLEDVARPFFLLPPILVILAPAVLVLNQPDLGTAVMLVAIGTMLLFAAGVRLWMFALAGGLAGAVLPVAWSHLHDYQRQRVMTFLDPERDPLGAGYHIIQSKIALGSGGMWGKGLLSGTQAQLSFLPEKQTDFAFTMLAEEGGFIAALVVLALYLAMILIALSVALRCVHQFGRLLALGVAINLFLYVVINIAMVTGLIPVVGVPLPLISYGGTAMLTILISFGLLLSVDLHRNIQIPRFPVDL